MVKIDFDTREVAALANKLALFGGNVRAKAVGRGLYKVGKQGAVAAKQEITKEYNVKSGEVARRMRVMTTKAGMQVEIQGKARNARSNRIPLVQFGAKDNKRTGVRFAVRKGGGRTLLRHAFIATMPSGHTGVYQRDPKTRKIKEVFGIDITHMMMGKRVLPAVIAKIKSNIGRVVAHELTYELSKLGFK